MRSRRLSKPKLTDGIVSAIDTASAELSGARTKVDDMEGSNNVAAILSSIARKLWKSFLKCKILGYKLAKDNYNDVFIFYQMWLSANRPSHCFPTSAPSFCQNSARRLLRSARLRVLCNKLQYRFNLSKINSVMATHEVVHEKRRWSYLNRLSASENTSRTFLN